MSYFTSREKIFGEVPCPWEATGKNCGENYRGRRKELGDFYGRGRGMGDDEAILAADQGRAIYRSEVHHASGFLYGNHDPGVCALSLQALGAPSAPPRPYGDDIIRGPLFGIDASGRMSRIRP